MGQLAALPLADRPAHVSESLAAHSLSRPRSVGGEQSTRSKNKNKELIEKLNGSSVNPEEIYQEYKSHLDELELMKPEINSAKESYNKLVAEVDHAFKNLGDTTKAK